MKSYQDYMFRIKMESSDLDALGREIAEFIRFNNAVDLSYLMEIYRRLCTITSTYRLTMTEVKNLERLKRVYYDRYGVTPWTVADGQILKQIFDMSPDVGADTTH